MGRPKSARLISLCSFVEAEGSAVVNGKPYRWEFHRMFGPTFLKADGEPLKTQPGERHPVWKAFEAWHAKHKQSQSQL